MHAFLIVLIQINGVPYETSRRNMTMPVFMSDDIRFIINRFPLYRDRIMKAYRDNDEFKTLCEDFYSSALILQNHKKKIMRAKESNVEYQKLFLDLETEILNFLGVPNNEENNLDEL